MENDSASLLAYLRDDPPGHKVVHERVSDRWFVYAFETDPPEVSNVRKDIAGKLLEAGWIEDQGDATRAQFPGDDHAVYTLTDEGAKAAGRSG